MVATKSYVSYLNACSLSHKYLGKSNAIALVKTVGKNMESEGQFENAASIYKVFSVLDESFADLSAAATRKQTDIAQARQSEEGGDYSKALKQFQSLGFKYDSKRVAEKLARRLEKTFRKERQIC